MTPGVYIVTGPDYTGAVPGEMIQVKSRTKFGVVAVRILAKGAADLPKAAEAQKGFHLMPLSAYLASGLAYKPPNPRPLLALYESKAPQDIRYFDELGDATGKRLAASADSTDSLVASFRQIGLSTGKGSEWPTLDEPTKQGLARAVRVGAEIVDRKWEAAGYRLREKRRGNRINVTRGRPVLNVAKGQFRTSLDRPGTGEVSRFN